MKIPLYVVDAFAEQQFSGNPAAVCLLDHWLDERTLQNIAMENNLSETAFAVESGDAFAIRWFTPNSEVDLCGHATMAAAYVLSRYTNSVQNNQIHFKTIKRGSLIVSCLPEDTFRLDFPALSVVACGDELPSFIQALNTPPKAIYKGLDYLLEYECEQQILDLKVNDALITSLDARGIIATAPGVDTDCVSRCFYPTLNVKEDPVTGSAHCQIIPFWSQRLGKESLHAFQASSRGGHLRCRVQDDRVILEGRVRPYLQGDIILDSA